MSQHFRLLNEQQVHSLLPMPDLIAAMETALAKFSAREVLQPIRSVLTVGPTKAYFGLMPAYIPSPESLGAFVNAVCNNVLLETYRSNGRTSALDEETDEPPAAEPSVEWQVLKLEERVKVREALAALPPKDKDLIRWLFFEERDKDDICRELQVDREYLRVLLHRAKQRFRERFASGEQQT